MASRNHPWFEIGIPRLRSVDELYARRLSGMPTEGVSANFIKKRREQPHVLFIEAINYREGHWQSRVMRNDLHSSRK